MSSKQKAVLMAHLSILRETGQKGINSANETAKKKGIGEREKNKEGEPGDKGKKTK